MLSNIGQYNIPLLSGESVGVRLVGVRVGLERAYPSFTRKLQPPSLRKRRRDIQALVLTIPRPRNLRRRCTKTNPFPKRPRPCHHPRRSGTILTPAIIPPCRCCAPRTRRSCSSHTTCGCVQTQLVMNPRLTVRFLGVDGRCGVGAFAG